MWTRLNLSHRGDMVKDAKQCPLIICMGLYERARAAKVEAYRSLYRYSRFTAQGL